MLEIASFRTQGAKRLSDNQARQGSQPNVQHIKDEKHLAGIIIQFDNIKQNDNGYQPDCIGAKNTVNFPAVSGSPLWFVYITVVI